MWTEMPWCSAIGSAARKTPWSAAARMVELRRVVPSTQKSLSTTSSNSRSEKSVISLTQEEDHAEAGQGCGGHQKLRNAIHAEPGHHRFDDADQHRDHGEPDQQDHARYPGIEPAPRHQDADHENAEER